ncbi:hypothetical protein RchiOBHm_Chr1g0315751 [Rosa chinensis]|uniref:Uncharacterized protein n=1 Tax=Rosa chinensis TaxID=74649 RepID=A0A2P6S7I6_ROSCH|nr:hypothetical protein RchiOBHm_Chr1g0315751 [Rosa chinensis]
MIGVLDMVRRIEICLCFFIFQMTEISSIFWFIWFLLSLVGKLKNMENLIHGASLEDG